MKSFSCIRTGLLSVILGIFLGATLQAADGFSSKLSPVDQTSAGLDTLSPTELTALDQLVAADIAFTRQLAAANNGTFTSRLNAEQRQAAGLARLTPEQLAQLDTQITAAFSTRPQPKERPKLTRNDLLGQYSRIEVHGGASFTIGGGSGSSFREYAGWASFYDPVTGISLGVGYSNFTGKGFPYGYRGNYFNDFGYDNLGYEVFPSRRLGYQDQNWNQRRLRANRDRWHGQSTDLELRLPLGKNENFLTLQLNTESIRSGN